jgi:hypothetical protein
MTLGLAMIVAFGVYEAFAPYPMIPPKLFQNKVTTLINLED